MLLAEWCDTGCGHDEALHIIFILDLLQAFLHTDMSILGLTGVRP